MNRRRLPVIDPERRRFQDDPTGFVHLLAKQVFILTNLKFGDLDQFGAAARGGAMAPR